MTDISHEAENTDDFHCLSSGLIQHIVFNNGSKLELGDDSIVVFVGPNNVGKSQSLKDIFELLNQQPSNTTVVRSIKINRPSKEKMTELLDNNSATRFDNGQKYYQGLNYSFHASALDSYEYVPAFPWGLREFLSAFLDTEKRLLVCNPAAPRGRDMPISHPIDLVASSSSCSEALSTCFRRAFGTDVMADKFYGSGTPLRIGEPVSFPVDHVDERVLDRYSLELDKLKFAHMQGDGMRSYLGIMLYLLVDHYRVLLIDEPESFLHPPQAEAIGYSIGEMLRETQQAFISTHSKEVILGLLEACPNRVKIVRVTREADDNTFFVLDTNTIKTIWNDSLLRYSEILNGLFHPSVVLCESDSDCKIYSIINGSIDAERGEHSETLFVHCGGKHRIPKVASSLKRLGVKVTVVADIDLLDSEYTLKGIFESCGGSWSDLEGLYHSFASSLSNPTKEISRSFLKSEINATLDSDTTTFVSEQDIEKIAAMLKIRSKWTALKELGTVGIASGQQTETYMRINEILKNKRIFLVPCGEVENFVKTIGGHGPKWVDAVLEAHADLNDEVYEGIREFVRSWKY